MTDHCEFPFSTYTIVEVAQVLVWAVRVGNLEFADACWEEIKRRKPREGDSHTTLADLRQRVAEFVTARDWGRHQDPRSLSAALAVEAAELMEHFLWLTNRQAGAAMQDEAKRAAVAYELADVLIYGLSLANTLDVDVSTVVLSKLELNERRFPVKVEGARGT